MAVLRRRQAPLLPVGPDQLSGLLRLCAVEPVSAVPLAHQMLRWNRWGRGDLVAVGTLACPRAAAWATSGVMPFGLAARQGLGGITRGEAQAMAEHCLTRLARRGSVLGPVQDVAALWRPLCEMGAHSREERWNQPLLCAGHAPDGAGLAAAQVRRRPALAWVAQGLHQARAVEEERVLGASVAMFSGELGYDPTETGPSYARHVGWLVAAGRSYVVVDDGAGRPARAGAAGERAPVAFKADVGALWRAPDGAIAQLTGVWTRPDLRGQGVGAMALAATVDAVRRDHVGPQGTVSLYVNDFNAAALALYRSVGFHQVGTFATILL